MVKRHIIPVSGILNHEVGIVRRSESGWRNLMDIVRAGSP